MLPEPYSGLRRFSIQSCAVHSVRVLGNAILTPTGTTSAYSVSMSLISIVHDFAVLYSTRVHQKEKRWSDGRLRFYEFNNKIEVVSEEQALIMVDFYPQNAKQPLESGVFADGTTYTFPSGKMVVEFSEYLGCTERDVSKAFSRSSTPRVKREEGSPAALVTSKHIKTVSVKLEENLAPSVKRARRVGLAKPKRQSKQLELTRFIKPVRETIEDRLRKAIGHPSKTPRILPGSNNLTRRLHMQLGITSNSNPLLQSRSNSSNSNEMIPQSDTPVIKEEKRDYY